MIIAGRDDHLDPPRGQHLEPDMLGARVLPHRQIAAALREFKLPRQNFTFYAEAGREQPPDARAARRGAFSQNSSTVSKKDSYGI